jgi:hypothetical protein
MKFTLAPFSGHFYIYVGGWLCFMFLANTRRRNILMWFRKKYYGSENRYFFLLECTRLRWVIHLALKWCGVWELIEFHDKNLLPCFKAKVHSFICIFKNYFIDIFLGVKILFFKSISAWIFFLFIKKNCQAAFKNFTYSICDDSSLTLKKLHLTVGPEFILYQFHLFLKYNF